MGRPAKTTLDRAMEAKAKAEALGHLVRAVRVEGKPYVLEFHIGLDDPVDDSLWDIDLGPKPRPPVNYEDAPYIARHLRQQVVARDGYICAYCGEECQGNHHIDHIHPRSRGGKNTLENLTIACARCNRSKGNRTLDEWRRRQ